MNNRRKAEYESILAKLEKFVRVHEPSEIRWLKRNIKNTLGIDDAAVIAEQMTGEKRLELAMAKYQKMMEEARDFYRVNGLEAYHISRLGKMSDDELMAEIKVLVGPPVVDVLDEMKEEILDV